MRNACVDPFQSSHIPLNTNTCAHIFHSKVLVFTHCGIGLGPTSVPQLIEDLNAKALLAAKATPNRATSSPQKSVANDPLSNCNWIPFSDSSKLSFICLGHSSDTYFQQAIEIYQQLLDVSGQHGQLFVAGNDGGDSSKKATKNVFGGDTSAQLPTIAQWKSDIMPQLIDKMIEINYKRFEAVLKCGAYHKLEAAIIIWPPPKVKSQQHESSLRSPINFLAFISTGIHRQKFGHSTSNFAQN